MASVVLFAFVMIVSESSSREVTTVKVHASPKIAFLFLTRGPIPLDFIWHRWLKGMPPSQYSIYIHAPPGYVYNATTTRSSYFYGRQITGSIVVEWGEISMIEAERRLLKAALQDTANKRFVLLSDSCIPLQKFKYVYNYIMSSQRSFVDSFVDSEANTEHRYNPLMSPTITKKQWRKGSQWFTLVRKHARALIQDTKLLEAFRLHCKRVVVPEDAMSQLDLLMAGGLANLTHPPDCIPDEHYLQTFFAVAGLEDELERRTLTYSFWRPYDPKRDKREWHPKTFGMADVTLKLVTDIQNIRKIEYATEWRTEQCVANEQSMPCYLFARKFSWTAGIGILKRFSKVIGLPQYDFHGHTHSTRAEGDSTTTA
eukprot:TRINITY_DN16046_c0_g1_i1.p1 TRINITY_DN16046_c0_g1~~TRINITY_DN16046_c0_g1_i1.p1  ORF type:complete len:427 (-),score=61.57 TRINITY_DN16046_c0_g1_i1:811-1920(-)